jgi:CYTH domain-containing protein
MNNAHNLRALLSGFTGQGLEGQIDGKKAQELEYTFYGCVADPTQFQRAVHKETHEQWRLNVETDKAVRLRIRCINGMRWVLTTKVQREGTPGWEEVECDISVDMFNHLKEVATDGYMKTRYNFKIQGSDNIWEVDVFKDSTGKDHPWVKIDLEVHSGSDAIPPLPMDFNDDMIVHQGDDLTEQERSFMKDLWSKHWQGLDVDQKTKA